MTVRRHVHWSVRASLALVAFAIAFAAGIAFGRLELPWTGTGQGARLEESDRLRRELTATIAERDRLAAATPVDSQAVMDRSTLASLEDQVRRLEVDNARLKDDVAFYDGATAGRQLRGARQPVSIPRFQVTQDRASHRARFRLLVTQDSRSAQGFVGDLQLSVGLQRAGKAVTIAVPSSPPSTSSEGIQYDGDPAVFRLDFRSYKRVDGSFRLAPDVAIVSVQAKVLDRGVVVAQQTASVE